MFLFTRRKRGCKHIIIESYVFVAYIIYNLREKWRHDRFI